jgi:hypothetical protein
MAKENFVQIHYKIKNLGVFAVKKIRIQGNKNKNQLILLCKGIKFVTCFL